MRQLASRLRGIVDRAEENLMMIPVSWNPKLARGSVRVRPAPGKWSPIEVLGHLVDSAANNQLRFIQARFTHELVFAGYDQDAWVDEQQYTKRDWNEVVAQFSAMNRHIAGIIETTPSNIANLERARHNLDKIAWRPVSTKIPTTLAYFMADYVEHLMHHLRQLLGPEFA